MLSIQGTTQNQGPSWYFHPGDLAGPANEPMSLPYIQVTVLGLKPAGQPAVGSKEHRAPGIVTAMHPGKEPDS